MTAWRGNLRQTLPLTIAVCAVLSLGLGLAGRVSRERWVREWYTGPHEMAVVTQALGDRWERPTIPPDAWRAEPPPASGKG